jgi:pyruvate ferredoxin oxidoreductase alpha subunit
MPKLLSLTGNEAAAHALRQANPDVAAVYPITPQTELMHQFAEFVANGKVDTEMILVESEHSAMSAAVGASAAGARTVTATSANGLALMWEIVYIAASSRLPIVMPEVNRALSGPINIHCDHSDTMGCRDSGWIQLFAETGQEAYDNTLQAFRIAEHPDVRLPVMIPFDGFIISHTNEPVELLDDAVAAEFVGEYDAPRSLLDTDNPMTVGPLDLQDYYFEHKRQQVEAMRVAKGVIKEVGEEFGEKFGRKYGFIEGYKLEDAEVVLIVMGSTCGTTSVAVDVARAAGIKAGMLKVRSFRPFPTEEIRAALGNAKKIGVLDRCISFGLEGGPLFHEIRSALYGESKPLLPFVFGLGGRDIRVEQIGDAIKKVADAETLDAEVEFIGIRD